MDSKAKQDQETVRRVLKAALNNLDDESQSDLGSANSVSSGGNDAVAPVILVLVDGLTARGEGGTSPVVAVSGRRSIEEPSYSRADQPPGDQVVHPGLERFLLGVTDSLPAAPRECFMEPGRTCVSSGACEMRGF
jgi:hypothetical protein